jgi:mRNA-degrading endonuclease RelE of RelBE toxin-antitoxin system
MKVVQTPTFKRKYKKLNSTQRQIVREAMGVITPQYDEHHLFDIFRFYKISQWL